MVMALVTKINSTEMRMIENYIDAYATENRCVSGDYILRIWDEAKDNYLYRMFDNNLILSKTIEFRKELDEMATDLEHQMSSYGANPAANNFVKEFYMKVLNRFDFYSESTIYYAVRSLLDYYSLAENVYKGATVELPTPDGKSIKIQTGCRITRVLGRIAKAFEVENYEEFRIAHSMVLNQKYLKGNLCLSIHPLDYMTMSDNMCDWTSCMSWMDDGCYRQGTVEMMNSPMVVVAYLRAAEDMTMPGGLNPETHQHYTWNNKKWRQLFIVTPDLITNVKAYPYKNEQLTDMVLVWLKELAEKANIGEYTQNIYTYDKGVNFDIVEDNWNTHLRIRPYTANMYNDFSEDQRCFVGRNAYDTEVLEFHYSGLSECMACGSVDCSFDGEGMLAGDCCETHYYCDCCESQFYDADDLIEIDGMYLCEGCFEEYCHEDSLTGEYHHQDNLNEIHLGNIGHTGYHDDLTIYVYGDNMNDSMLRSYFKKIHYYSGFYRGAYFVNPEDCTEAGLELFEFNSIDDIEECAKPHWFVEFNKNWTVMDVTHWSEIRHHWTLGTHIEVVKKIS